VRREKRDAYKTLVGKTESRRPLEIPRRKCEENYTKLTLRETGLEDVE
jgi:hypothetical protein